jgi:hypothetical protein
MIYKTSFNAAKIPLYRISIRITSKYIMFQYQTYQYTCRYETSQYETTQYETSQYERPKSQLLCRLQHERSERPVNITAPKVAIVHF